MAKGLNIAGGDVGWTITSYSLIFGSLLLLGGRAADLLGRRRMFLSGLGIFVIASLAAALAGSAASLFAARAGQGLGAALLSPAALSILMSTFPQGTPRTHALAAWGAVGGAGAAVGVLLGGVLTELARLAGDLPHQPPDRHRARHRRAPDDPRRHQHPAVARSRPARRAAGHRQPRRHRLRALAGRRHRLDLRADGHPPHGRTCGTDRLRRSSSGTPPSRCCASSGSPTAASAAAWP